MANLPAIGDSLPPTGSVTINCGTSYPTSTSVSLSMPASDTQAAARATFTASTRVVG